MPLQFDMHTAEITYEGHKVGEYCVENGVAKVTLDLTYECGIEEWIVPLSWFDYGLNLLQKHQVKPREVAVEVETEEDDIAEHYTALRLLTEKTIKQTGYIWRFHKSDPDPWPSVLHAHEYDRNLKLDAITGDIFDATTRVRCMRLKKGKLRDIQAQLRDSPDFSATVAHHIDDPD